MAHFMKPPSAPSGDYDVDNKLAPGSVSGMRIPLGEARDIVLWGGGGLYVHSESPDVAYVIDDSELQSESKDSYILSLCGYSLGTCQVQARLKQTVWLSLSVEVVAIVGSLSGPVLNLSARRSVLGALADPSVKKINLTVDGFSIIPENYERVRDAIIRGSITVRYNRSLKNPRSGLPYGRYTPSLDILELGFSSAPSAKAIGVIIHEATHAACDIEKFDSMTITTSEILAYVAQAIVMRTKSPDAAFEEDPVVASSQPLAEIVLSGRQLSDDILKSIRKAIEDHPDYSSNASGSKMPYDGVR